MKRRLFFSKSSSGSITLPTMTSDITTTNSDSISGNIYITNGAPNSQINLTVSIRGFVVNNGVSNPRVVANITSSYFTASVDTTSGSDTYSNVEIITLDSNGEHTMTYSGNLSGYDNVDVVNFEMFITSTETTGSFYTDKTAGQLL
tara:strand:+ start:255 stop:692 length:438 start_codon:yes stop_codon:yes gene_type:complete